MTLRVKVKAVEMWVSPELQFGCPLWCSVNEAEGITDSGAVSGPEDSVPTWNGRKTVDKVSDECL